MMQVTEACKLLLGSDTLLDEMLYIDLWNSSFQTLAVKQNPACPVCGQP